MRNEKSIFWGVFLAIAFSLLILDTKSAVSGVSEGIALCMEAVIPSLFPFLLLSPMLTAYIPDLPLLRILGKFLGIPSGSESIFLTSLLSGYPVGARLVADAWKDGRISQKDAQRMLAFCNNAGPAFIFGIGSSVFSPKWIPWALWLIHILSAILVGFLLPGKSNRSCTLEAGNAPSFQKNLETSMVVMAHICGWIIIMRTILSFLDRWVLWLLPQQLQVLACGILELANGCVSLRLIADPTARFLFMAGFLAFGGISVQMQTISVIGKLQGGKHHLFGKLLHTVISLFLATLFLIFGNHAQGNKPVLIVFCVVAAIIFVILFYIQRKNSSIHRLCGV